MADGTAGEDPNVGQVFDGRYEILARIGEGGMGMVYRARQLAMGREVALKVLHPTRTTQDAAVARFLREVKTTSRIDHPSVVRVYDFGKMESGDFFLAMELLKGETLRDRLERVGALAIDEACDIAMQIAEALGAAHAEGIVHRDLKPENVMLCTVRGEPDRVRVLDFGIATFVEGVEEPDTPRVTRTGSFVGTPHYASPEQAVGDPLDGRSDLYSLGVLLYRMVTGRVPFDAPGKPLRVLRMQMTERPQLPSSVAPTALPAWLDALLMCLLEKDPRDRPRDAQDVIQRLASRTVPDTLEIEDTGLVDGGGIRDEILDGAAQWRVLVAAIVAAFAAGFLGWLLGFAARG